MKPKTQKITREFPLLVTIIVKVPVGSDTADGFDLRLRDAVIYGIADSIRPDPYEPVADWFEYKYLDPKTGKEEWWNLTSADIVSGGAKPMDGVLVRSAKRTAYDAKGRLTEVTPGALGLGLGHIPPRDEELFPEDMVHATAKIYDGEFVGASQGEFVFGFVRKRQADGFAKSLRRREKLESSVEKRSKKWIVKVPVL